MSSGDSPTESVDKNESAPGNRSYAILRNPDLRLYLVGRLIAIIGQQMVGTAILWEVFYRTHSVMKLGLVGLTQAVPMILFTLPAGHIADNYNRKRVITLMTLAMTAASIGLTFISFYQARVFLMYVCLFVIGASRTVLAASSASFLPALVDRQDLSRAVNWSAATFQLSSIIGPITAGGLIAVTGKHAYPVYAINVCASLIFAGMMTRIRTHHVVASREPMSFKTLLTGFDFVFANKIILGIITLDMFAVLLGGATALLPVYADLILHAGSVGQGLLQAAMPMGAVLCTFILAHRPPIQKAGHSLLWVVTAFGIATIFFGLSRWFWVSFVLLFTCGAVDNVSVVIRHTLVQLLTPDDKRGRVSAVNNLFIGTSNEMGEFESGFVAWLFGPAIGNTAVMGTIISVVGGGFGTIAVVIGIALLFPAVRKYGRLDA